MIAASFAIATAVATVTIEFMVEFEGAELIMILKIAGYMVLWMQFLAPSIFFVLFYAAVYLIAITTVFFRYYKERQEFIQFSYLLLVAFVTFWYLLHQRELKRFYEQQKAVAKEIKAVKKEKEVTNVLNLQKNAVIIFSQSYDSEIKVGSEASSQQTPTIEFANFTGSNLFKIDIDELNDLTKLKLRQFVPLMKTEAELYETEPPARIW